MNSLSLIHTSWLKPFADYFADRQISLSPYFEGAQIEARQATVGEGWITKQQLYRFLNAVAEGEQLPELGFVVGDTISLASLGALGDAMAEAETLADAIRIFCLLINQHTEENRAWIEEGDNGEMWLFDETRNPFLADRSIADHAGLMTLINLVRLAGGVGWYPGKVTLQTGTTSAFREVPGLSHACFRFDCTATGLAFPCHWLMSPIKSLAIRSPDRTSSEGLLRHDETVVDKLQRLLSEIIGIGGICPSFKLMAELCGTSPRTLHRRLRDAGVFYHELIDDVRFKRACSKLQHSDISVKELALDLGYSGANNFIRAFRRKASKTPGQFRKECLPR